MLLFFKATTNLYLVYGSSLMPAICKILSPPPNSLHPPQTKIKPYDKTLSTFQLFGQPFVYLVDCLQAVMSFLELALSTMVEVDHIKCKNHGNSCSEDKSQSPSVSYSSHLPPLFKQLPQISTLSTPRLHTTYNSAPRQWGRGRCLEFHSSNFLHSQQLR